jgi:hypothetical protein
MKVNSRMIAIVAVLLGMSLPAVTLAQTPLPKIPPKLTLLWLRSLTLSPTTVSAGVDVTGTITLERPAISDLSVGLQLSGATPIEGNIWVADGAIVQGNVTVPAGSDRATFKITTARPKSTTGSKTFTVTGAYAAERVSASFTIAQLVKPTFP